jgi:long-chain acyl-CoA synthetase
VFTLPDPVVNAGLLPMQVALSIQLIRVFSHPIVCGPICASHGLDLQYFPNGGNPDASAHVGPPSANIEIKLSGVDDTAIENGADPVGEVRRS